MGAQQREGETLVRRMLRGGRESKRGKEGDGKNNEVTRTKKWKGVCVSLHGDARSSVQTHNCLFQLRR